MDAVTQIVLGAAVGEATLGKKVGNKAVLWGAIAGIIPDLDVLAFPLLTDVQKLSFHRSFSHSIVFALLAAPLLAYLIAKIHGTQEASRRDWTKLAFWSVFTHPLLDCFTIYGTQLFQPFSDYPVALNTIFVIDPLYTLPLLLSVITLMFMNRTSKKRRATLYIGLGLSSLYLAFTVVNKFYINSKFEQALNNQNISYSRYFTNPAPLNNLLWRVVAESDDGYWEGLYSLLDQNAQVSFRFIAKNHELIKPYQNHVEIKELIFASKGYYSIIPKNAVLYFNDLRFGKTDLGILNDGDYIFSYAIENDAGDPNQLEIQRAVPNIRIRKKLLSMFFRRIQGKSP